MNHLQIVCKPIGVIRSEHTIAEETPIQPVYAKGCKGHVEVFPEYAEGLKDLDGFSHLYLLYHFHACGTVKLTVKPFLQDIDRGIFSTRAPFRPNPIGLSVVELLGVSEIAPQKKPRMACIFLMEHRFWTLNPTRKSLICAPSPKAAGRMMWMNQPPTGGEREGIAEHEIFH